MRKRLVPILKLLVAGGILTWMALSGRLNLSQVARAFSHWPELMGMLALVYIQVGVTVWRWRLLLDAQGFQVSLSRAFSLTMIGVLFNVVIPGAVGGDVMKGYYVSRHAKVRKAEAVGTILLDRVTGLLGLLVLVCVGILLHLDMLRSHPVLGGLGGFAAMAAVGASGVLALLVAFGGRFASAAPSGRWSRMISRLLLGLDAYAKRPLVLPVAVAVSAAGHVGAVAAVYLSLRALGATDIPYSMLLLVAPLGLMTLSVPVAPAGIGVGQAAFYSLFELVSPGSGPLGANALTVLQSVMLLVYLTGLYSYVSYRELPAETAAATGARD